MPGILSTGGPMGALSGGGVPGGGASIGALSGGGMSPELLRLLLSGMSQGSGLIPQGQPKSVIPTMRAGDWSTPREGTGMGGQSPEEMAAFLAWMKMNGLEGATGEAMPASTTPMAMPPPEAGTWGF